MKKLILFFLFLNFENLYPQVLLVNDAIFEDVVLRSSQPVIVKFFVPKCASCMQLDPIFSAVSDQVSGIKFMQLNTQLNGRTRDKYKVRTAPVIIIFENGKEVYRTNRVYSEQQLLEFIRKHAQ